MIISRLWFYLWLCNGQGVSVEHMNNTDNV